LEDSHDLKIYFRNNFTAISKFFPIQLMTYTTFETLVGASREITWDNLMIVEAATLNNEQGCSLLSKADKAMVFGTGNTGPWPSYNSFWELSKKIAGKTLFLKRQHHSSPLPLRASLTITES